MRDVGDEIDAHALKLLFTGQIAQHHDGGRLAGSCSPGGVERSNEGFKAPIDRKAMGELHLQRFGAVQDFGDGIEDDRRADGVGDGLADQRHLDELFGGRVADDDRPIAVHDDEGIGQHPGDGA